MKLVVLFFLKLFFHLLFVLLNFVKPKEKTSRRKKRRKSVKHHTAFIASRHFPEAQTADWMEEVLFRKEPKTFPSSSPYRSL